MPFSITNQQGRQVLKLEGAVTIRDAQDLSAILGEALGNFSPLVVDTLELEDIDTCILQMMCSLRKTIAGISFHDASDVFVNAVDRCALRRELLSVRENA